MVHQCQCVYIYGEHTPFIAAMLSVGFIWEITRTAANQMSKSCSTTEPTPQKWVFPRWKRMRSLEDLLARCNFFVTAEEQHVQSECTWLMLGD